jgi:hypothetical protein
MASAKRVNKPKISLLDSALFAAPGAIQHYL